MVSRGATFIAPLPGSPPVGMSATDGRLSLGGIFGVTPQLVSGGGIAQSGSAMTFTLAQSVFQLGDVTNAAATAFLPTDSIALTIAAGPGSGSREDLICIPLKNYENGDASSQSVPIIVAGTAGSPGVAPAVPAGSYKYAQIHVPTSAANAAACTVTTFGNSTFSPPDLQVQSLALLQTITGGNTQQATVWNDTSNNGLYQWLAGAWKRVAGGVVAVIPSSPTSGVTVTSSGKVVIAAGTSGPIIIDGITGYENYQVLMKLFTSASTAPTLQFRTTAPATDTGLNYDYEYFSASGASATAGNNGGSAVAQISLALVAATRHTIDGLLIAPGLAETTEFSFKLTNRTVGTAATGQLDGANRLSTVHAGLSITIPSGTVSGAVWVKGLSD